MVIPKGLIIYRAPRHGESRPLSLKYKKHSDKSSLSASSKKPHRINPKRLIQKITLLIDTEKLEPSLVTRSFQNLHQAKKCVLSFQEDFASSSEDSIELAIKIIRQIFKTLKGLRHVEFDNFGPLQRNPKTFKNILRQKHLKSLTFTSLYFSEDFRPFLKFLRAASRSKCWPHFESLRVEDFDADDDTNEGLMNLGTFLKNIKKYDVLYKCFSFNITFPDTEDEKTQKIIEAILKLEPPITHLTTSHPRHIPQKAKGLKSLYLDFSGSNQEKINLKTVNKLSAFQKLGLSICQARDQNLAFYFNLFAQIQLMTGLKSLTLDFLEKPKFASELEPHFLDMFKKLTELTDLKLGFNDSKNSRPQPQLENLFTEIGQKKKLKTLCLEFTEFNYKNKKGGPLFGTLCKSIAELKQLTKLHLEIDSTNSIRDHEFKMLALCLQSTSQLETLFIHIDNAEFQDKAFRFLMDCIIQDLPKLSDLILFVSSLNMTRQCFQYINKAIHKKKLLNYMRIDIIGLHEEFSDNLDAEVQKRMTGGISCRENYSLGL